MTKYTTELLTPRRRPARSRAALVGTVALVAVLFGIGWVQHITQSAPPIVILATAQPTGARGLAKSVRTFSARPTPTAAPTATAIVETVIVVQPVYVPVEAPAETGDIVSPVSTPEPTAILEVYSWPAATPVMAQQVR